MTEGIFINGDEVDESTENSIMVYEYESHITTSLEIKHINYNFAISNSGNLQKTTSSKLFFDTDVSLIVKCKKRNQEEQTCEYEIQVVIDMVDNVDGDYTSSINTSVELSGNKIEGIDNTELAEYVTRTIFDNDKYDILNRYCLSYKYIIIDKILMKLL